MTTHKIKKYREQISGGEGKKKMFREKETGAGPGDGGGGRTKRTGS